MDNISVANIVYCALQVGCQSALPATLHKTILCGPFSYCVVCSLHALCSLQSDNQPAKHNISGGGGGGGLQVKNATDKLIETTV